MLTPSSDEHLVTFCRTDAELADAAASYLLTGLGQGGAAVAVATPSHLRDIDLRFSEAGIDPVAARSSGGYVVLDAAATLDRFLVSGSPDPAAFWRVISPVIGRAASRQRPVRVVGEMVSLLWQDGQFSAAIELEALWHELARQHSFSLLCAYLGAGGCHEPSDDLAMVVGAHNRIVGG